MLRITRRPALLRWDIYNLQKQIDSLNQVAEHASADLRTETQRDIECLTVKIERVRCKIQKRRAHTRYHRLLGW